MERKEIKYYGYHAVIALWESRPEDVIRVYVRDDLVKPLAKILKWCALHKKAYHIVKEEELCKISDSVHHEGVCILARELPLISYQTFMRSLKEKKICLFYLDGVENPHNIGSIIRSCAHFGIPYILGEEGKLPTLSPSAYRIAKGGAEVVRLIALRNPKEALDLLMGKGFELVGTSSHGGKEIYGFEFPVRSIIVMGSESKGMSRALEKAVKHQIQIPGSGLIESLNVSVASALCMSEYVRQHRFQK